MKKALPWIVVLAVAGLVAGMVARHEDTAGWNYRAFGRLPVLANGRIKPLDTLARTSLLLLHDKQTLSRSDDGGRMTAIEWLTEVFFAPARADARDLFAIHDPQVLALFGWKQTSAEKDFSFQDLQPHLAEVQRQAQLANSVEAQARSPFQRHVLDLFRSLQLYVQLKAGFDVDPSGDLAAGVQRLLVSNVRVVPPAADSEDRTAWRNIGESLVATVHGAPVDPVVQAYARIGGAFRSGDAAGFNAAVADLSAWMGDHFAPEMRKARQEQFFNHYSPFTNAMFVYVLVFVLACLSWLTGPGTLRRTAFLLTGLALVIHTSGLAFRMYLEGRPPVTNLYSSAVFIGWAAALLGLGLEWLYKNGVGSVIAAVIGFCTLLIAHHLSFSGDTLEMMQAVLDNNFWLATHVVVITLGYSATFAAGALAIAYILMGVFSRWLRQPFTWGEPATSTAAGTGAPATQSASAAVVSRRAPVETNARALTRMIYGVVCFATLCSFVGTVLGGIWADQSWGRFWGWDPKENGAALIVIWNAIILHARWGGYIRDRGLAVMAVFGNVVTSWSWFGVNMLGIGLHSYGFMDRALMWLVGFVVSQLALMALGSLPLERWRSFAPEKRSEPEPLEAPPGEPEPASLHAH